MDLYLGKRVAEKAPVGLGGLLHDCEIFANLRLKLLSPGVRQDPQPVCGADAAVRGQAAGDGGVQYSAVQYSTVQYSTVQYSVYR